MGGFCIAGLFGDCGGDAETRNSTENDINRQNLMKVLQKHSSTVGNTAIASQRVSVNVGGDILCANFSATNFMKGQMRFISRVTQQLTADIKAAFQTAIDQGIEAENNDKRELLSVPNNNATVNDIKNKLTDIVDRSITNETLSEIVNKFDLNQVTEVNVKGDMKGIMCNMGNNMVLDLMTTSIIDQVNSVVTTDQTLIDLITKAQAAGLFESKGLNSMVDSIVGFFKSAIGMYALIVIAIIIGIVVIMKSLFSGVSSMASSKGQQQYPQGQPQYQQQYPQGQPQYVR